MNFPRVLHTNDRFKLVFLVLICGLAAAGLSGCRMPAAEQDSTQSVEQQEEERMIDEAAAAQDPTQTTQPTSTETILDETPELAEDNGLDAAYEDPELGFSFDYPGEWERGYEERGVRGGFFTFIDPEGSPAEILVQVTIYRWDPTQDLEAYQEKRRSAWESSQIEILDEADWSWKDGVPVKSFRLESLEGEIVDVYLTYTGDYYLEFTTTSEFETLEVIVSTLR